MKIYSTSLSTREMQIELCHDNKGKENEKARGKKENLEKKRGQWRKEPSRGEGDGKA